MKQTIKQRAELQRSIVMIDCKNLNLGVKRHPPTALATLIATAKNAIVNLAVVLAIGAFVFILCAAMAMVML